MDRGGTGLVGKRGPAAAGRILTTGKRRAGTSANSPFSRRSRITGLLGVGGGAGPVLEELAGRAAEAGPLLGEPFFGGAAVCEQAPITRLSGSGRRAAVRQPYLCRGDSLCTSRSVRRMCQEPQQGPDTGGLTDESTGQGGTSKAGHDDRRRRRRSRKRDV